MLEATDVWLKSFDPAAFMPCIRMKLQALGAHPGLEDTAFTGDMAVLPPKLCSCKLKVGMVPSAVHLDPTATCEVTNQICIQSKLYIILAIRFEN